MAQGAPTGRLRSPLRLRRKRPRLNRAPVKKKQAGEAPRRDPAAGSMCRATLLAMQPSRARGTDAPNFRHTSRQYRSAECFPAAAPRPPDVVSMPHFRRDAWQFASSYSARCVENSILRCAPGQEQPLPFPNSRHSLEEADSRQGPVGEEGASGPASRTVRTARDPFPGSPAS